MGRNRNSKGQFASNIDKETFTIRIPGPIKILKILFILIVVFLIILPWIFVLFYRLRIKELFLRIVEFIFIEGIADDSTNKKTNGFF